MRFQKRDAEIISSIHYFGDGLLAQRQLKKLHFPDVSLRAMQKRMSKLRQQNYIMRATNQHWSTKPIPEQIYWLGWKGAIWLADQNDVKVELPKNTGENQMRELQRKLRQKGFRWLREPRWSQLHHDIAVGDFFLALKKSAADLPSIRIDYWVRESEFRSSVDHVEYKYRNKGGEVVQAKRGVCPDFFFTILDGERRTVGRPHRLNLLLEIDMGTHPIGSRFGLQKAVPYAAYIKSPSYKSRFGVNAGVWLVVTTGKQRMANLMKQTEERVGMDIQYFLFSNFDELKNANLLTHQVWWKGDDNKPRSLLSI